METEKEHFSWLSQKQLLVERYTEEKWEWGIPLHRVCVRQSSTKERGISNSEHKHTLCFDLLPLKDWSVYVLDGPCQFYRVY